MLLLADTVGSEVGCEPANRSFLHQLEADNCSCEKHWDNREG